MTRRFAVGDPVIYRKTKHSRHPGPRAKSIYPAERGDDYSYQVDKYWIVAEVGTDGTLRLRTRRGKEHVLNADNPNLRHAHWWERLLLRQRFPALDKSGSTSSTPS